MTIKLSDVKDELYDLEAVQAMLAPLEAMGESEFAMGDGSVSFQLPDDWNSSLDQMEGTDTTSALAIIDGQSFSLTKDAALAASSLVGLSRRYMSVTPGHLIEPHMNYWYGHEGGYQAWSKNLKLIWRPEPVQSDDQPGGVGVAFCRSAMTAFSMQRVLEEALDSIYKKYGKSTEVLFTKKMQIGIRGTQIRLLIPETERTMKSKFAEDEGNDPWSAGLALQLSLTGELPLQASGFMLRYVCLNGATTEHALTAKHRRGRNEDLEEVYTWVGNEVDTILGALEGEMDAVDSLTSMTFESGDLGETLKQLYDQFRVPVSAREQITNELMESADVSAYGLMQAVTEAANDADLSASEVARLMRIGGSIPHILSGRCPSCHRLPS